jgi:hypothetical protein
MKCPKLVESTAVWALILVMTPTIKAQSQDICRSHTHTASGTGVTRKLAGDMARAFWNLAVRYHDGPNWLIPCRATSICIDPYHIRTTSQIGSRCTFRAQPGTLK